MFRFLVREVLVHGVICPLVDRVSEPDYLNQNIIWMVRDININSLASSPHSLRVVLVGRVTHVSYYIKKKLHFS